MCIKQTLLLEEDEEDSASFDDRIAIFDDQSFHDVDHSLCDDEEVSLANRFLHVT